MKGLFQLLPTELACHPAAKRAFATREPGRGIFSVTPVTIHVAEQMQTCQQDRHTPDRFRGRTHLYAPGVCNLVPLDR
jgi:hypothetical protein